MNLEELAFFNLQLGGMLQSGIPLEGAVKQLALNMRKGVLREEMELLTDDLAKGVPLAEALPLRKFPPFYSQMLLLGAKSQNLPGVLILVSDHYQRMHSLWSRLKGMLVYPAIVLLVAFALSALFSFFLWGTVFDNEVWIMDYGATWYGEPSESKWYFNAVGLWLPPASLLLMIIVLSIIWLTPRLRQTLGWRIPGFRESSLSQLASSMSLLLRTGSALPEAIALMGQMTGDKALQRELSRWQERLASGMGHFPELVERGSLVPPLFVWMVANAGEELGEGFAQAAELFGARAQYRYDMFLYAVLPVSVLLLGFMILGQLYFVTNVFLEFMRMLAW